MCLQFAIPAVSGQVGAAPGAHAAAAMAAPGATGAQQAATCILAGNDIVGDVLANYLGATGLAVDRIYEDSYNALVDVYRGRAHIALAHLYDGATDSYNVGSNLVVCSMCFAFDHPQLHMSGALLPGGAGRLLCDNGKRTIRNVA